MIYIYIYKNLFVTIVLSSHTVLYLHRLSVLTLMFYLLILYFVCSTACMKLEGYATAKAALEKGASVAPNESKFEKMIDECNLLIAGFSHQLLSLREHVL